jgi:hypothetical protein
MGPGEVQRNTGEVLFRGGLGMTAAAPASRGEISGLIDQAVKIANQTEGA